MFDLISHYHLALGTGVDIVRENADQALNVSAGWDDYWEATYQQTNGLWLAAIYLSTLIVSCTFLVFCLAFLKALVTNQWWSAFEQYFWVGAVLMLLNNNGAMLIPAVKAMRSIAVEPTQVIYEISIAGIAIEEALKDTLVTADIKQQIASEFRTCEVKTGEQQLECIKDVGELAEEKINQAERRWGPLAGLERLRDRVVRNVQDIINEPTRLIGGLARLTLDGPIVGSIVQANIHRFLKLCQWGFANLFELSLAITGLYAPIAVALSSIPSPTRYLWHWLITFSSVAVAIWSYAIMVGMVGWVVASSGTQTYADTGFLLIIGLIAPIAAMRLAKGGGIGIWQSVTSTAVTILRAVT